MKGGDTLLYIASQSGHLEVVVFSLFSLVSFLLFSKNNENNESLAFRVKSLVFSV